MASLALPKPSSLQTTLADTRSHLSSHTVPHSPFRSTSTRPSPIWAPPLSRTRGCWRNRSRQTSGGAPQVLAGLSHLLCHITRSHPTSPSPPGVVNGKGVGQRWLWSKLPLQHPHGGLSSWIPSGGNIRGQNHPPSIQRLQPCDKKQPPCSRLHLATVFNDGLRPSPPEWFCS